MASNQSVGVRSPGRRGRRVAAAALIGALAVSPFLGVLGGAPQSASAVPGASFGKASGSISGLAGGGRIAPMVVPNPIHPFVSTRVASEARYVRAGETISDDWTLNLPEGESWPELPVEFVLEGTLYGPFKEKPVESAQPPADAPVFQTFEGLVVTEQSPTVRVTSNPVPEGEEGQGWYVFVARFDGRSQDDLTGTWLDAGYSSQDRFGLREETSVRVADVSTRAQASVPAYGDATDTAIVNGAIPESTDLVFELWDNAGTPGDTSDDVSLGITDPVEVPTGFYENAEFVSPPVNVGNPFAGMTSNEARAEYDARHSTYWVETLRIDGEAFHVGERELPGETTDVPHVNVTTQAQPTGVYQGYATDTAIVNGSMPVGSSLEFELFAQDDEGGDRSLGITSPIAVKSGAYVDHEIVSPPLRLTEPGTTYWVERIRVGDDLIHEGERRLPNETTEVSTPSVRTEATAEVPLGGSARDTAVVDGEVPAGSYLKFEAFFIPDGYDVSANGPVVLPVDGSVPACVDAERVFAPEDQVLVASGVNEGARYESAEFAPERVGTYYWVETLYAPDGSIIHRGECGAPGETTVVVEPPAGGSGGLTVTGGGALWPILLIGGGLLAAAGAAFVVKRRLDAKHEAEAGDEVEAETEADAEAEAEAEGAVEAASATESTTAPVGDSA